MFKSNTRLKFTSYLLTSLFFLALLMTSSAPSRGQGKNGGKKAPEKAANNRASDEETGLIMSPDHKSATLKSGFKAEKIADHQAVIKRATGLASPVKVVVDCLCNGGDGLCLIVTGENLPTLSCRKSSCDQNCNLQVTIKPIKR